MGENMFLDREQYYVYQDRVRIKRPCTNIFYLQKFALLEEHKSNFTISGVRIVIKHYYGDLKYVWCN